MLPPSIRYTLRFRQVTITLTRVCSDVTQESYGVNYQKLGKELMSQDELSVMDNSQCILQIRGLHPFMSKKFDITKHKNYGKLFDSDKKNYFDVARFVKSRQKNAAVLQNTQYTEYR